MEAGLKTTIPEAPAEIFRLASNWQSPIPVDTLEHNNEPYFELPDEQASVMGIIIHHCLSQIADSNLDNWTKNRIDEKQSYWLKLLKQFGYQDAEHGLKLINQAVTQTLNDQRGRWILSKHIDSTSEFPITVIIDGGLKNYIIDRTFIDDDGARWIIDYKTSTPTEKTTQDFLNQEAEKYSGQLSEYAKAMQIFEPIQKIRLGLYFPLFGGWIEIKI